MAACCALPRGAMAASKPDAFSNRAATLDACYAAIAQVPANGLSAQDAKALSKAAQANLSSNDSLNRYWAQLSDQLISREPRILDLDPQACSDTIASWQRSPPPSTSSTPSAASAGGPADAELVSALLACLGGAAIPPDETTHPALYMVAGR